MIGISGRLAQLGEHLVYTEGVGGSIPSPPTNFFNKVRKYEKLETQVSNGMTKHIFQEPKNRQLVEITQRLLCAEYLEFLGRLVRMKLIRLRA